MQPLDHDAGHLPISAQCRQTRVRDAQFRKAVESGKLTADDGAKLTEQLKALDIDVNPRYGTFSPDTASIELTTPGWVKPLNAAQ